MRRCRMPRKTLRAMSSILSKLTPPDEFHVHILKCGTPMTLYCAHLDGQLRQTMQQVALQLRGAQEHRAVLGLGEKSQAHAIQLFPRRMAPLKNFYLPFLNFAGKCRELL